jgi:N-acetylneuraminic acid mutarotase
MRAATAVIRTGTWRGKRIEARSAMMSNLGRRRAVMLLGCLMLALTVSIASAADPSETWSVAAHLPQPRGETAMAALNGKLYVLGGYTPGNEASPLAEEYDPTSKAWRVLPPIPRTVSHPGVAALDGKLYVVGGFTANVHAGAIDSAFVYDPATNAWRALSPMTKPRGSVAVAALDGKLHALGGRGLDKVTVATHEVYDPETGKWSFVAPLPVARDHLAVVAADGKLHAIGGRTNNNTTDNTALHDVYDPATDRWSESAALPTARSAIAATLLDGLIIVVGGECDHGHTFNQAEAYDPPNDQWRTLVSPEGRHGFGAATVGDTAYFAGGNKGCGGGDVTDELLGLRLR